MTALLTASIMLGQGIALGFVVPATWRNARWVIPGLLVESAFVLAAVDWALAP